MDKLNHPIDLDHITDDQAIKATVEMWTDMMTALGKKPEPRLRNMYKHNWLELNGYGSIYPGTTLVSSDCFLCERAVVRWRKSGYQKMRCDYCPIRWPHDSASQGVKCVRDTLDYRLSPLSDILDYLEDEKNRRNNG